MTKEFICSTNTLAMSPLYNHTNTSAMSLIYIIKCYIQIPVIADLPVGENLRDHIFLDSVKFTVEKPVTIVASHLGLLDKLEYNFFGTGMFKIVFSYFNSILILLLHLVTISHCASMFRPLKTPAINAVDELIS